VHLVGFTIEIYYDAWSYRRQKLVAPFRIPEATATKPQPETIYPDKLSL
jgi:hypothetical protein